jgi:hypothetical protein
MIYALQGLLSNTEFTKQRLTAQQAATCAIEMADALLAANTIDEVPSETP